MPSAPSPATACGPKSGRNSRRASRIPTIIEFYGATEGNVSMLNYDGKVGAVGRVPGYMRGIITTRIVRFDIEHEMPVRGADGLCSECAAGEVGEAIGLIADKRRAEFRGLYPRRRHARRRSCATSSSTATPGSAPAT